MTPNALTPQGRGQRGPLPVRGGGPQQQIRSAVRVQCPLQNSADRPPASEVRLQVLQSPSEGRRIWAGRGLRVCAAAVFVRVGVDVPVVAAVREGLWGVFETLVIGPSPSPAACPIPSAMPVTSVPPLPLLIFPHSPVPWSLPSPAPRRGGLGVDWDPRAQGHIRRKNVNGRYPLPPDPDPPPPPPFSPPPSAPLFCVFRGPFLTRKIFFGAFGSHNCQLARRRVTPPRVGPCARMTRIHRESITCGSNPLLISNASLPPPPTSTRIPTPMGSRSICTHSIRLPTASRLVGVCVDARARNAWSFLAPGQWSSIVSPHRRAAKMLRTLRNPPPPPFQTKGTKNFFAPLAVRTLWGRTVRCARAVRKVGYFGPVFPNGQGDRGNYWGSGAFNWGGGGGVNRAPKLGGGVWEKGSIDRTINQLL